MESKTQTMYLIHHILLYVYCRLHSRHIIQREIIIQMESWEILGRARTGYCHRSVLAMLEEGRRGAGRR